jgi:hypothetical protein
VSDEPQWDTVCATAHRKLTAAQQAWLEVELYRIAYKLKVEHGTVTAISGMALGGDQIWAEQALFAELRLVAAIPFAAQADSWPREAQERWAQLLAAAAEVETVSDVDPDSPREAARLLHARNDWMLDRSRAVVAVADPSKRRWDGRGRIRGGTWGAVAKAHRRRLPVIWVNPAAEKTCMPTEGTLARLLRPEGDATSEGDLTCG